MVAVVCAGCVRAPVTSHAWSILRESPRDCKCFGASSGKAPSSGRGSRAWGGFQAWESRTVRGVQARRADQPRHAVLLDAAAPRHTTMGAPCDAGQVWPSGVPWGCHVGGKNGVTTSLCLPLVGAYDPFPYPLDHTEYCYLFKFLVTHSLEPESGPAMFRPLAL